MRAASSLTAAFASGVIALWLPACAGKKEDGPTILAGMDSIAVEPQTGAADPRLPALAAEDPIFLTYRSPDSGGIAYRLTLEIEGERAARSASDNGQQSLIREAQALEADFRKLPAEHTDPGNDIFLVGLDRLLYKQKQQDPPLDRNIELADDRLRITNNGETSVDNRGNRVIGPLEPRLFLGRIFGVITHDPSGNPTRLSSRGAPAARQLMSTIPLLGAIAYTMVSLPQDPVTPGSRWTGARIPPSRSGELGLSWTINYSLTGFEIFQGVPCAMILLDARIDEFAVTSVLGHEFDRVQATLNGTAWVELENSLVRRVVVKDQIRASWTRPAEPNTTTEHRIQHVSKLELALRDANKKPDKWSDGTPHFESR